MTDQPDSARAEHTSLPWQHVQEYEDLPRSRIIISADWQMVADCECGSAEKNKANAAYIVRACNAYPDLVRALEPFVKIGLVQDTDLSGVDAIDAPDLAITANDVRRARAALKAAREGE